MTLSFPAGTLVRPVLHEDAEAVLALIHSNTLAISGEIDESLKELLEEWADPDLDLARDSRVVFAPDGRLIAYALLWNKNRLALPILEIYLHASEWDTDTVTEPGLLAWAEARTWENVGDIPPELRIAVRTYCDSREERFLKLVEAEGYSAIRHSFRMGITFEGPPEPGTWPEGFVLRVAEKDTDMMPVFDALRDAWRDHFGYIEAPYDEAMVSWKHHWTEQFAPGLWLLAMDGDTVAGMCINYPRFGEDETIGFVEIVGVRRAYRRRGVAEALLRRSFAALYAAGKTSACLYVDGKSLTGATRLYERVGMSVTSRYILNEKELRPGIDPSTQQAGVAESAGEAQN
ncbi:MAG: GNAT family N-acetyltransferase [Anaerolineae bacterium]